MVVGAGREDGGAGDPVQQPRAVGEARPHAGVVQPEPAGPIRRGGVGVDGDQLEIGAPAQAEQGVVGAEAGVPTARSEPDPELLLEGGHAVGEVGGGHDEVVDGGCRWHGVRRYGGRLE